MQLVTLAAERGVGVVIDEEILEVAGSRNVIRAAGLIPATVRGILDAGDMALDLVRRVVDEVGTRDNLAERLREISALIARDGVRLRAPIPNPGLILSCGLNYHAHLREMNTPVPAAPTAFTKNVAQLIGSGEAIMLPPSHPNMVVREGNSAR